MSELEHLMKKFDGIEPHRYPCVDCPRLIVLNPHHIVDGAPVKSCNQGNDPDTCHLKDEP